MNIRSRLTLGFLACGVAPLVAASLIGYWSWVNGVSTLREHAAEDIRVRAVSLLEQQRGLKTQEVEEYFAWIGDQAVTFAEDRMVVEAMRHLPGFFKGYAEEVTENGASIAQLRRELREYYAGDFAKKYAELNDGATPDFEAWINGLDDESVTLQHAYLRDNKNPLGSKHLLDTSDEETDYGRLHAVIHPVIRSYLEKFGYYDIFLIDNESGDVVYSVFKEIDFATSLKEGAYASSNFGRAFRKAQELAKGEVTLVDFEQYAPSCEAPASFIATPIFDGDERLGVLCFQMPVDRIKAIMAYREGLGETGETILVGADRKMRSDSYLKPETHSLDASFLKGDAGRIESAAIEAALDGEKGSVVAKDYRGVETLSAYGPVDLLGLRWAIVSKMDAKEAFAPVERMQAAADSIAAGMFWTNATAIAIAIAAVLTIAALLIRSVLSPIRSLMTRLQDIAEGEADLTRRFDESSSDELGELAHWFNVFIERIQQILLQVSRTSLSLSSASEELAMTAVSLAAGAEQTGQQSSRASHAAEQMSYGIGEIATTSEQMAANIRSVAAATEEMTSTIHEIAKNAEQSANVADRAARLAEVSNERVGGLGEAANEIGKVIEVIQDIAEQTNLLALNATIEAARAGEAGKGFAVVASEVKDLAKQTASATDDIRRRIEGIQNSTGDAVNSIREITAVITNVNDVARTIAAAVEEQSITTREISQNVSQAASATDVVVTGVTQSATASRGITQNIVGVNDGVRHTAVAAGDTKTAGAEVARLATELNGMVSQFRL